MDRLSLLVMIFMSNAVIALFALIYRDSINQEIKDSYFKVYDDGQRYGRCVFAHSFDSVNHAFRVLDPVTKQERFSFQEEHYDQVGKQFTPSPFTDLTNRCNIGTSFPDPKSFYGSFSSIWMACFLVTIAMITIYTMTKRPTSALACDPWDLPIQGYDPKIEKTELEILLDQAKAAEMEIPNKFCCPISKMPVRRPVLFTQEIITYDASSISSWMNQCKNENRPCKTPTGNQLNGYISLGRDRRFEQEFITFLKEELQKKEHVEVKSSPTLGSKKTN